ncbi:MAG: phosphoribosylanthranilate isomerase [Gammaproteobacteria bacterium]|nr:phosphoribosylanthranilate isomerase [Gammaproteobacteria bacterium]
MRTRIKICGITRPLDALAAAAAGVDAIGLIFYRDSPRYVRPEQACEVIRTVPPFVTVVGVFFDAEDAAVAEVVESVPVDMLQFHGDESPEYCTAWPRPYLKGIRMRDNTDILGAAMRFHTARGLLVDTYAPGSPGGTGEVFDWGRVEGTVETPLILAGGLTAENVGAAIEKVRPYAVDVSSGVEIEKGIKDDQKIMRFVQAVHQADGT